jgi:thioredoxin 1
MERKMKRLFSAILTVLVIFAIHCSKDSQPEAKANTNSSQAKVTFIELGSDKCIPCKAMQPVLKAIEEKYGDQINVVFYDVWKEDQKKYGQQYNIKLIPTQVFLDADGNELMRHEGFFPEEEIDAFLQKQGLKPKTES